MSMIFCRGCGKELHESAVSCPHCGAPQSSASADLGKKNSKARKPMWVKILIVIFALLAFVIAKSAYQGYKREHPGTGTATTQSDEFAELAAATPAQLLPTGELAAMFNLMSENTDLQRKNKLKEIKGKIIEWTLPVYEVRQAGSGYAVQTEADQTVGTIAYITARNEQDKALIESLKTGSRISFKGVIKDVSMRHLEIKPAILFQPGSAKPVAIEVQQPVANQQIQAPAQSDAPQATPQATWKPSFDCAKASTFSEKAICSDTLLGKLDGALSENYKYMLASDIGDGARNDLKTTQKNWLVERNKCANNQCLVNAYRKRLDEVCEYPVISGAHPNCTSSDDIKSESLTKVILVN